MKSTEEGMRKNNPSLIGADRGIFGPKPDTTRIAEDLAGIEQSRTRKPATIRYMDRGQLETLRQEIIDALVTQGTTKSKAEELTVTLVSSNVEHAPDIGERKIAPLNTTRDSQEQSTMPYLDKNGDIVIPWNCPKRYRWWQGGQTIAETRIELTSGGSRNAELPEQKRIQDLDEKPNEPREKQLCNDAELLAEPGRLHDK